MQRKKTVVFSVLLCLLLSGCAANKSIKTEKSNSSVTASKTASGDNSSDRSEVSRDSENVKFLYAKPQSEQPAVGIYNCEYADISEKNYLALFSKDPECEKKSFSETKRRIHEYKTDSESGRIAYTDDILQSASYSTERGVNYMAVEDGNDELDTTAEFDFISRAELSQKIKSIMLDLFNADVLVTIDAVTAERFTGDAAEHLEAVAELYGSAPSIDKYGTPENFYIVSFVQKIENVTFDGGYGKAVYTSNGLEYLYISAPMKIGSKITPNADFITLDGAEKLLKEKYELLLLDEPESFIKAELTYAHSDNALIPVWKFTSEKGVETTFNAYTGKEIVWGIPGEGA